MYANYSILFSQNYLRNKNKFSPPPLPWTLRNTKSTTMRDLQRTGKAINKYEPLN